MSRPARDADAELAALLAYRAGQLLLELGATSGLSGRALGDAGDAQANAYLVEQLRQHRPDDGLLSEESRDTLDRLDRRRVWIIDPVDGTREYGEGRDDWAVHVALAVDGVAAASAVALPARGNVLRTDRPTPVARDEGRCRIAISRSRPPREAEAVAAAVGGSLLPMGSAGAKAMAVVEGRAEAYVHSGGQYEWDSCAPVAVAAAHGLHCSRLDGTPLRYNRRDTYVADLVVCHEADAATIIAAAASV